MIFDPSIICVGIAALLIGFFLILAFKPCRRCNHSRREVVKYIIGKKCLQLLRCRDCEHEWVEEIKDN